MITPAKQRHALYAMHLVLVYARSMAYEGTAQARIADVLDWAELLPGCIDAKKDCTHRFRSALEAIVEKEPAFAPVLAAFDRDVEPRWHGEDVRPD
jgi:hypothetical protein